MKINEDFIKKIEVSIILDGVEKYLIHPYCGECHDKDFYVPWSGKVIARKGTDGYTHVVFPCEYHIEEYEYNPHRHFGPAWEIIYE